MAYLRFLLQKEFLQIRRNSFLPRLIIIFPIVIMCVTPFVMNQEVKHIVVDVVDNDKTTSSRLLTKTIEASSYFVYNGQKPTYSSALKDIEQSRADIAVVIPKGYSSDRAEGKTPQILIAANAVNGTKGSIGSGYLSQIFTTYANPTATALQSQISVLNLYNKHQNYKVYMIPALMAILILLMCGFLPALNIVGEKEKGTIEQINVTPISKWTFILSKLIPYWIIAFLVMTECFALSWMVFGITSQGSLLLVYLLAMLLALVFSSFGLIVSNYSDTMQQAIFVMWFFVVILLLLSGLFTPTASMPEWIYTTTYVNPMHYFIDAIRTVFIRGGTFQSISRQVLALSVIAATMSAWAVISYKKNS